MRAGILAACGAALAIVAVASCDDPFAPASVLETFRPLAVRAEPPMVRPGEQAVLDALIFDPRERSLTHLWIACDPPAGACDDGPAITALESGTLELPAGMRSLGTATTAAYRAPEGIEGDATAIVLLVTRAERETAIARKEILISTTETNRNPQIEYVLLRSFRLEPGEPLGVQFGRSVTLSAITTATSAEMYTRRGPDGREEQRIEDVRLAWYTTQGRYGTEYEPPSVKPIIDLFVDAGPPPRDAGPREGGGESSSDEYGRKVTLTFPSELDATSSSARIFVIVLDGRGGTTWAERSVALLR